MHTKVYVMRTSLAAFLGMLLFVLIVSVVNADVEVVTDVQETAMLVDESPAIDVLAEPTLANTNETEFVEVISEALPQVPSPLIEALVEVPVEQSVNAPGTAEEESILPAVSMRFAAPLLVEEQYGTIVVVLNAIPNNAQNFTFTNNFGNGNPPTFQLDDDSNPALLDTATATVAMGTYSVTQAVPSGWNFKGASCSDGSPAGAVEVSEGEIVVCTFTNQKLGTITVVKNAIDGDGTFDFQATGASLPEDFQITTSGGTQSVTFSNIDPENTYSVSEIVQAGWELTDARCTRGTPDSFTITSGGSVTCTFENTAVATLPGSISVKKETIPRGALEYFSFTGAIDNVIRDGEVADAVVVPGTYSVTEVPTGGWTVASIVCDDADSMVNTDGGTTQFSVSEDESVLCTYTNVKDPSIEIVGSAAYEVGNEHVFTVILGQNTQDTFTPVPDGTTAEITITPSGYTLLEDTCASQGTTSGLCTVRVQVDAPGAFTAHAAATVELGGLEYNLETDGVGENTGDATVQYIDGRIQISPLSADITIGDTQVEAVVEELYGEGSEASNGAVVTFSIFSGAEFAHFHDDVSTCTTEASGTCAVTLVATTPGSVIVHAQTHIVADGAEFDRETDGTHGSSLDAVLAVKASRIVIEKVAIGGDGQFGFEASYTTDGFTLSGGETNDSGYLPLGMYRVDEVPQQGWYQKSAACDNGNGPDAIMLTGEMDTVTCSFVNEQYGHLVVSKVTEPGGDPTEFSITISGDGEITGSPVTTISTGNDAVFEVTTGTYSVTEDNYSGWEEVSNTCIGVMLLPGETKHCTIMNRKVTEPVTATLTVVKDAQPNSLHNFLFTLKGVATSTFILDDDASMRYGNATYSNTKVFEGLNPGVATVQEVLIGKRWTQSSVQCMDANGVLIPVVKKTLGVSVTLQPGGAVTCTFVNKQSGKQPHYDDKDDRDMEDDAREKSDRKRG